WHAPRQAIGDRLLAHEGLDDPVLERMEAHDREPAFGLEQLHRLWQRHLQLFKLLIDVNPNSLEGAGRRMLPRLARANRTTHDLGKLFRETDGPARASRDNRSCNPFSKPFFPIGAHHLPDFVFLCTREPLRGALAVRGIHAHVERTFLHEAESSGALVELRARDAEVEKHSGYMAYS